MGDILFLGIEVTSLVKDFLTVSFIGVQGSLDTLIEGSRKDVKKGNLPTNRDVNRKIEQSFLPLCKDQEVRSRFYFQMITE